MALRRSTAGWMLGAMCLAVIAPAIAYWITGAPWTLWALLGAPVSVLLLLALGRLLYWRQQVNSASVKAMERALQQYVHEYNRHLHDAEAHAVLGRMRTELLRYAREQGGQGSPMHLKRRARFHVQEEHVRHIREASRKLAGHTGPGTAPRISTRYHDEGEDVAAGPLRSAGHS